MPDLSKTIVYRAVKGAMKNALDGHPKWSVPPALARSVAKRAAGTLFGLQAGDALAVSRRSAMRGAGIKSTPRRGRTIAANWSSSLPAFKKLIEGEISKAHRSGDSTRFADLCYVARILKEEMVFAEFQKALKEQKNARE